MRLDELYYSNLEYYNSDKGTYHDYINSYYRYEFSGKRKSFVNLLEIGLLEGGSMRLWVDWFKYGKMYGIDVIDINIDGAIIHSNSDAYTNTTSSKFKDCFFDYIIDDGPHTLESQILAIQHWLPKLKIGGKLIIEDVQSMDYADTLFYEVSKYNAMCRCLDFRQNKRRYDDIIFEVTKI
jgi:hypothetical protein